MPSTYELSIQNKIDTYKAGVPILSSINSPSEVSIWKALRDAFAYMASLQNDVFTSVKEDMVELSKATIYGTEEWWIQKLYEFQYGDYLYVEEIDGIVKVRYAEENLTKRVIKKAAIKRANDGQAVIKIATSNGTDLEAVSSAVLLAVKSYVRKLQAPGTNIDVQSFNADFARYYMRIFYDPIVSLVDIEQDVYSAIVAYLNDVEFNGILDLRKMEDLIQKVNGVVTFNIDKAQARPSVGSLIDFEPTYESRAGYVRLDPLALPLSFTGSGTNTITYIPITSVD